MYVFFKSDGHLRPKNRPCKTTGAVRKYRTAPAETYPNARAIRPAGHPGNAPKAAQVRPECPGHCGGHPSRLFHHDLVHEQESLAAGARVPGRDRSGILRDHLQVTGRRFGKLHPVTPDAVGIPGLRFGHRDRGHLGKIRPVIRNPHRNRRGREYPVALLGERLQLHRPIGLAPRPCRWSRRVARPDTPARHRS